jgi:hypothetical protein
MQQLKITFDTSEAEAQVAELVLLLRKVFVDHLPDYIVEYLSGLSSDIVIADGRTALGTDAILEKHFIIRCGTRFNDLMTALRAGKILDLAHATHTSIAKDFPSRSAI